MRKLYSRLFHERGWWSPLATAPGWFAEDLAGGQVAATLEATEGADTAAFQATITHEGGPATITAVLNVTEQPDTAHFSVTLPVPAPTGGIATGPFLGGPKKQEPKPVTAVLRSREEPDRVWVRARITAPAGLPEPRKEWEPVPFPVRTMPAPEPGIPPHLVERVRPVQRARLRTRERKDTVAIKASVTGVDWVAYDNAALMVLLENQPC